MGDETQKQLAYYVNKASDLAESVRRDLQKNKGVLSSTTIVALNDFIIAANVIKSLTDELDQDTIKLN